ncbi:MAG: hypothetical protein ACRDX8_04560, partial [Acidimicrobiales bacterium]
MRRLRAGSLSGPRRGMTALVPAGLVVGLGGLAFNVVVGRLTGTAAYGAIGTLLIAGTIGTFCAQGAQYELAASVSRAGQGSDQAPDQAPGQAPDQAPDQAPG